MTPKISVIIPTYNRRTMLEGALKSVFEQDFQDYEIVVVDDGSKDDTRAFCESLVLGDSRVRYVYQENRGPAAAQNTGLREARGEWVALLGDDDIWCPGKLSTQASLLAEAPEAVLCFSNAVWWDGKSENRTFFDTSGFQGEPTLEALIECNFVPASSVLARKRCLEEAGGFDESLRVAEDYDLWLRCRLKGPFVFEKRPLYKFRLHNDGHLTSDQPEMWRSIRRVLEKNRALLQAASPALSGILKNRLGRYCHDELYRELMAGRRAEGAAALARAIRYQPWRWKNYFYGLSLALPRTWVRSISISRYGGRA